MKSRNFNLVVLLVLLVATAVIVSSQGRREKVVDDSVAESRVDERTHPRRESLDGRVVMSSTTLPKVAVGAYPESDGFFPAHYAAELGDSVTVFRLESSTLFRIENEVETSIPLSNREASHLSGLAYDTERHRLVVSSFGSEGFFDFYDLNKEEWTKSVSLQGKDVQGITCWKDRICGVEMNHGETTADSLLLFDSDGNFERKLDLSFPVIAPDPRLAGGQEQLTLYSGGQPELSYQIDRESGEVTGNFRQGYQGTPAALVAVYEASDDHDSIGTLEVAVDSQAPPVLVLSAYEGVHWKISGGEHLNKVIVNGYDQPVVSGLPQDCQVIVMSYETSEDFLPFAHEIQSHEMCSLLYKLEQQGIGVKSIAAGYQATTAIVH